MSLLIIESQHLTYGSTFPEIKDRSFDFDILTVRAGLNFLRYLIGIDLQDIISDISRVMSAEIKIGVVSRAEDSLLISRSLIKDQERPVLEPSVEYI